MQIEDLSDRTLEAVVNAFDDESANSLLVLSETGEWSVLVSREQAFREFTRRAADRARLREPREDL